MTRTDGRVLGKSGILYVTFYVLFDGAWIFIYGLQVSQRTSLWGFYHWFALSF